MRTTLTSSEVMALAGIGTRVSLMQFRNGLGFPAVKQRAGGFSVVEAALLSLAAELTNEHGLRRAEAISISVAALRDLSRLLVNEDDLEHWLLAHRLTGDPNWAVTVTHANAAHEILFGEAREGSGHIVVDLAAIVRRVNEVATGHG